jgi:hypothetical protein
MGKYRVGSDFVGLIGFQPQPYDIKQGIVQKNNDKDDAYRENREHWFKVIGDPGPQKGRGCRNPSQLNKPADSLFQFFSEKELFLYQLMAQIHRNEFLGNQD